MSQKFDTHSFNQFVTFSNMQFSQLLMEYIRQPIRSLIFVTIRGQVLMTNFNMFLILQLSFKILVLKVQNMFVFSFVVSFLSGLLYFLDHLSHSSTILSWVFLFPCPFLCITIIGIVFLCILRYIPAILFFVKFTYNFHIPCLSWSSFLYLNFCFILYPFNWSIIVHSLNTFPPAQLSFYKVQYWLHSLFFSHFRIYAFALSIHYCFSFNIFTKYWFFVKCFSSNS